MQPLIEQLLALSPIWGSFGTILLFFFAAWVVHRLGSNIAKRLIYLDRFTGRRQRLRAERVNTLRGLLASTISFLAFTIAALFSLSLFVTTDTIIWMVGLFSAAFGLGARPLISDYLTGISFIFEDTFDIGEKIEMAGLNVQGIIEAVNLRTTVVRGTSGEQYVVPNGEVRVVRNFSRGRFSVADIVIKLPSSQLNRAIPVLEQLANEAVVLLPNLLEPWHVISESGTIGQQVELTLATKARYGRAADMRPRLLGLVQDRLEKEGIELVG